MTHAVDALSRAPSAALETHRAPRTKSFAAKPIGTTAATISPAAQAAFAAAPPEVHAAADATPAATAAKAYRTTEAAT